jgi:hypothetical protein
MRAEPFADPRIVERMRKGPFEVAILLVIMLAGCRGGGDGGANGSAGGGSAAKGDVQTATLTGLYEGGEGPRRNQLCMIEREGRAASFGFVAWGSGDTSCSGSGPATREGQALRLVLDGDESCTLEARIDGRRVTFPPNVQPECARYYCGGDARLTGLTFDKIGGEEADARRATDLVGDRLCG